MSEFSLKFKPLSDSALLLEWPHHIDDGILKDIIALQTRVETELNGLIVETINAYNSLTIIFDPQIIPAQELEEKINSIHREKFKTSVEKKKVWSIPVCYEKEFGIDLEEIAASKKCSEENIIHQHTKPEYVVYFTGFLPGFLYLGGLPTTLLIPRKSTPRLNIIKGAVAIGGAQTGIYPSASPGGWNIIGNSPLDFFDPQQIPPCFAKAGDRLKFYQVDKSDYDKIKRSVENGTFEIECTLE